MVQIYQVSDALPSSILDLQKRITTCMDALNNISDTWLVAKMVHNMFEAVLGLPELENRLRREASIDFLREIRQSSINQAIESPLSTSSATSKSSTTRATSLTPSLAEHMAAALQSATKKHPSSTHINQSAKSHNLPCHNQEKVICATSLDSLKHTHLQLEHPEQHLLNFVPETSRMDWDRFVPEQTQSMGLNTDEWWVDSARFSSNFLKRCQLLTDLFVGSTSSVFIEIPIRTFRAARHWARKQPWQGFLVVSWNMSSIRYNPFSTVPRNPRMIWPASFGNIPALSHSLGKRRRMNHAIG